MLLFLLFCLVLSQITIFFVYTESENHLSELAYFRVLGTELYEVYEISTKKNHLPSLPQPLCPKVPQKFGNNILLMLSWHLDLHQNEIGKN